MTKSTDVMPPVQKDRGFFRKLIIAILIVVAISGLLYIIYEEVIELPNSLNVIRVQDVFVDINNDGLVDFISKADVVINTGNNLNLPVSP